MVKLSRQELETEMALDSFDIVSDEKLRAAMSYSPEMLDINELFAKTNVSFTEMIDLSAFPDVKVIQASSQRQLDMVLPTSKQQIESVHLSNNEPVGWDNDFNMENSSRMDRNIDLSDYANIQSAESHFYLNTDLESIELPESVKTLKFQHSKLPALTIDNVEHLDEIVINRSLMNNIEKGENISINASIINGEETNYDDDYYDEPQYSIVDEFEQEQAEDGMFELKVNDNVVLKSDKPFEIQEVNDYGFHERNENSENKIFTKVGVNGKIFALSGNDLYHIYKAPDDGIGRYLDKVIFENTSKDEKIDSYSYLSSNSEGFGGTFSMRQGYSEIYGRRDVGRGYTPVETSLFLVRDGNVLPETVCTQNSEMRNCGADLYNKFMNNIKEKGIVLTPEEKEYKDNFLREYARMAIAQGYNNVYGFSKEMFRTVKDAVSPEVRRNYILDYSDKDPTLIEFIPEMIADNNLSVKDLLEIKNVTKQEAALRHISKEVLKGNESAKDLLMLSLSQKENQVSLRKNAIDVSNIPFLIRLSAQSGANLSEEKNIYGQLFDRLSNGAIGDFNRQETSVLYNSVKTLLDLGVKIDEDTLNNGYSGTSLNLSKQWGKTVNYTITDPAARLALKVSDVENNKDAQKLYQLLVDNVQSQEDINNMTLYQMLATPKGKSSAKLDILSPRATYEDIEMGDAISMGRIDVCHSLYEKGRKPEYYDLSNLQAHARGAYMDSDEEKRNAAEFIKFATQSERH